VCRNDTGRLRAAPSAREHHSPVRPAPLVHAVLFDIDGTLVDSVDLHARAWQEAFAHFGIRADFPAVRSQIGKGGDQILPVFVPADRLDELEEPITEFRRKLYRERYLPEVRPFPRVRELFQRLRDDGVHLALASSAHESELHDYERIANIADLVEHATSSDDAERSKPHPDIFAAALAKLGSPPAADCLVVGDSPYDAIAAGKIGLRTLGVRCGGFPDDELRRAGCVALHDDPAALLAAHPGPFVRG
jgi:HAD superfamily hydrolase (TIGR01509 family)